MSENGVCASLIGRLIAEGSRLRRGHPFFLFWIGPKNIFACPLDSFAMGIMLQVILGMLQFLLLTRIPTSHAKVCTRLTPAGMSAEVSPPHVGGFFRDYSDCHVLVSLLYDFSGGEHVALEELSARSLTPVMSGWKIYNKSPVTFYGFTLLPVILFIATMWYLWLHQYYRALPMHWYSGLTL